MPNLNFLVVVAALLCVAGCVRLYEGIDKVPECRPHPPGPYREMQCTIRFHSGKIVNVDFQLEGEEPRYNYPATAKLENHTHAIGDVVTCYMPPYNGRVKLYKPEYHGKVLCSVLWSNVLYYLAIVFLIGCPIIRLITWDHPFYQNSTEHSEQSVSASSENGVADHAKAD